MIKYDTHKKEAIQLHQMTQNWLKMLIRTHERYWKDQENVVQCLDDFLICYLNTCSHLL